MQSAGPPHRLLQQPRGTLSVGGSATSSDSKSSAHYRHPRSLGPQDTEAECSLTEWQGAEPDREGLSKEVSGGRQGGSTNHSPWLPSPLGAPVPVVGENAERG